MDRDWLDQLIASEPALRYGALYLNGELATVERDALDGASSSESDRYEELIVNPSLITLVRQRGEIDCGGLEHVLVRYGNFYQFVLPLDGGHLSVAIEPDADVLAVAARVRSFAMQPSDNVEPLP